MRGEFQVALAKHLRQTTMMLVGFAMVMWGPVVLMLIN